jgi:hypothetical protein
MCGVFSRLNHLVHLVGQMEQNLRVQSHLNQKYAQSTRRERSIIGTTIITITTNVLMMKR